MERQLIRGFIDGALSTLGVVIGASGAQFTIIITAGVGGGVANGLSNLFGALTAERAAEEMRISKIERSMLREMKDTTIYGEVKKKAILGGLTDGMATVAGSIVPVLPFVVALYIGASVFSATMTAIALTTFCLSLIGIYLGKISRGSLMISALKMVVMGLVTALLSIFVERTVHTILGG
jgi:predicted membrane protein (TIGR00267 family)